MNTLRDQVKLSNHFSGTIDDVLIYKDALTESEIQEIYSRYIDPENFGIGIESPPFLTQLLSFTDHITITINNVTVFDTIYVAPIDLTSETPSVVQSVALNDYVTWKLNGLSSNDSVEVVV